MNPDAIKIDISELDSRSMADQAYTILIDDFQNHAHSASGKIEEACIPLDRLAEFLRHRFLQDGRSDHERLHEEIEAFVKTGNRLSIAYEELRKLDPCPKTMMSKADELKERYDEVITHEEKKRKTMGLTLLIAVPLATAVAGLVAFVVKRDQSNLSLAEALPKSMEGLLNLFLAALVGFVLPKFYLDAAKVALDVLEAARKAKEDATEKKREGAATMRGLASSFEFLRHDLSQILSSHEELMKVVSSTGDKIKLMIDKKHQHPAESESGLSKEVMNLTWMVEKIKRKAREIKWQAVEVEKSAANAAKDVSVLNILEDLAELLKDIPKDTTSMIA